MKEKIIRKLKEKGVKVTPQRIAIIDYLENNYNHPTAEDIYDYIIKEYPSISLATIYNTLDKLEEIHEIVKLKINEDNIANYDYNLQPHQHFYCLKCKKIYDVNNIEKISSMNEIDGHKITEIHIYLKGFCKKCI